jgi:hypothetical protein
VAELPNIPGAAAFLVDRREAGRLLCVCANTIDNLRLRGELASVKIGARRLYDVADLLRLISERKVGGIAAKGSTIVPAASDGSAGPEGGAR